jgi:cytochrome c2
MRLNKEDESSFIKLIGHPELMPHPRFSKADVANLITYLNTLPDEQTEPVHHDVKSNNSAPDAKSVKSPDLASVQAGKKLFYQSACLACHSVGGTGGSSGPALDKVAERRSVESIEAFIANPRPASGKQLMPPLKLTERERHQIADFLISLSVNSKK